MKREFWRDWKSKTEIEEAAIKSLRAAKKIILENVPRDELRAIYVKGSFVRREMNEKSDIDLTTIIKHNRLLRRLDKLAQEVKKKYKPDLNLGFFSLWELEHNKRHYETKKPRGRPDLFLRKLGNYRIIYGKPLDPNKYPQRDDQRALEIRIKTFWDLFLPMYRRGDLRFSEMIKQVFWLVELEELVKGNKAPESWKGLDRAITNPRHIIHPTYKYRVNRTKSKRLREQYINRLKTYLKQLERKY